MPRVTKRVVPALLMVAVLLGGCTDDTVQPPGENPPVVWQRYELPSRNDETILDLQAGDDDLFVLANRLHWNLDRQGDVTRPWSFPAMPIGYARPFVSRGYFVYPSNQGGIIHNSIIVNLRVTGTELPAVDQLPLVILDPTLSAHARYSAWDNHTAVAVVNDDGRMLAPVWDSYPSDDPDVFVSHQYAYLIQLSKMGGIISSSVERRIEWPYGPFHVMTAGGRFFASTIQATYEIGWDGSITKLVDHGAWDIVEHQGRIFIHGYDTIYSSADAGETWQPVVYTGVRGKFFVVDGSLCAMPWVGVFRVDVDAGTMTTLAYDGLPTGYGPWNAASQFGDRVYVATSKGLYYKPVSDFFTPHVAQ